MALVGIPNTLTLVSSTVPEDDAPIYVAATAYTAGQKVVYEHKVYLALRDSTGKTPGQNPDDWGDEGATNRYRVVDDIVGSLTTMPDTLSFTVSGERCNVIAIFEVYARYVDIEIADRLSGEIYFSKTIEMWDSDTDGWWSYFFIPLREKLDAFLYLDFPVINPLITVTLRNDTDEETADDTVSIGHFVTAMARNVGTTEWNPTAGANDYSVYDTNSFGQTYTKVGKWSKRGSFDLHTETYKTDTVGRILNSCRGRQVLFIGDDRQGGDGTEPIGFESMLIYGLLRDWETYYTNNEISKINIRMGGVI